MECPVISCLQKVILYETKARFYVVGSNATETCFRILKIDRTEPKELVMHDDKIEYSKSQIRNLLTMINHGNQTKDNKKSWEGLTKSVSAFGIFGFVRFLEGYYILLITKRSKKAIIGPHIIYKVEDTSMIYIPNDSVRYSHPEENRYVKMFQSVDVSNSYFSYSYDLTHTLQFNMAPTIKPKVNTEVNLNVHDLNLKSGITDTVQTEIEVTAQEKQTESEKDQVQQDKAENSINVESLSKPGKKKQQNIQGQADCVYGVRTKPEKKYVWNKFLVKKCEGIVHPDWIILITHGFIDQQNICVFGKPVYLTLIARRSNQFAGTRFLKRGANCQGHVANEVETEQIVHDASKTFLNKTNITSFVQMRGSIPLYWSQDVAKMVPKPPITIDQKDPFASVAGRHFNQVMRRYGSPVIIFNLIKKREKKRHESILSEEFKDAVKYLNQFLPSEHALRYIGFDMAHVSKSKNVLLRLADIAKYCVKQTGIYVTMAKEVDDSFWHSEELKGIQGVRTACGRKQTGVVRTNCVDCLDRTNTAQFALGKCALAYQLHILGVLKSPNLEYDTDCTRMLEQLYEAQGDTIALQYGGSQLVHRIEGYRKTAPWKSHSKDIMHTLSRYYSNTFSDLEKQQATNIFLGLFEPVEGKPNIWELPTDFYLHNKEFDHGQLACTRRSYSQWWDVPVYRSLPLPYEEVSKAQISEVDVYKADEERVNLYEEYYRTHEHTNMMEQFSCTMTHSVRNMKPKSAKMDSPFLRRVAADHTKDREDQDVNPNISGRDSSSSTTSTGSEGSNSSSDEMDAENISMSSSTSRTNSSKDISDIYGNEGIGLYTETRNDYGLDLGEPKMSDMNKYLSYVKIGMACMRPELKKRVFIDIESKSVFKLGSVFEVQPPPVMKQDQLLYERYVLCGIQGPRNPSRREADIYARYVSNKYL